MNIFRFEKEEHEKDQKTEKKTIQKWMLRGYILYIYISRVRFLKCLLECLCMVYFYLAGIQYYVYTSYTTYILAILYIIQVI